MGLAFRLQEVAVPEAEPEEEVTDLMGAVRGASRTIFFGAGLSFGFSYLKVPGVWEGFLNNYRVFSIGSLCSLFLKHPVSDWQIAQLKSIKMSRYGRDTHTRKHTRPSVLLHSWNSTLASRVIAR